MSDLKSMWIRSNQKKSRTHCHPVKFKILKDKFNQQNLICQYFFAPSLLG